MKNEEMTANAWALKETDTGRYRCRNLYVKEESYHRNILNAELYNSELEAKVFAKKMNEKARFDWLVVVPVSMQPLG